MPPEGLDFYNHNIDCSKEFYHKIITTRRFEDRISTLEKVKMARKGGNVIQRFISHRKVRSAGIKVCCGGIIGMGETNEDRVKMWDNHDNPGEISPELGGGD